VFDGMVSHAPDSIEPDTAAARDAFKTIQANLATNATNPAGALASNLVTGATSSGAFQAVGNYLQAHCPLSSAIARRYVKAQAPTSTTTGTTTAPTGSAVTAAPAIGTQLATFSGEGRVNVITNGNGFDIVDSLLANDNTDQSTVTSYDAAGNQLTELPAGSLIGECGAADVVVPGTGRLLLGYLVTTTPAQGIHPATASTEIKAWNADTGAAVWSAKLFDSDPGCKAFDGNLQDFSSTPDGRWGLALNNATGAGGKVIDLTTGAVRQDTYAIGMLGDFVVDTTSLAWGTDSPHYLLVDPKTGAIVGKVHNSGTANGTVDGNSSGTIGFSNASNGYLAPSGLFTPNGAGSSAPSGTTSTGSELIAIPSQEANQVRIYAYSLPSMNVLWRSPGSFMPDIVGDGGGTLVVIEQDCANQTNCVVGYDDQTGAQLWKLPSASVCGLTNSQMFIQINDDFADIDIKTGDQLSYVPDNGADCPQLYPGGLLVDAGANNGDPTATQTLSITQGIAP
jgi:hypothetical protein